MLDECLPMGCLSSRSTTVSPEVESSQARKGANNSRGGYGTTNSMANGIKSGEQRRLGGSGLANGYRNGNDLERPKDNYSDSGTSKEKRIVDIGTSLDRQSGSDHSDEGGGGAGGLDDGSGAGAGGTVGNGTDEEDDFMTILMNGEGTAEKNPASRSGSKREPDNSDSTRETEMEAKVGKGEHENTFDELELSGFSPNETPNDERALEISELPDGDTGNSPETNMDDTNTEQVAVALPHDKSMDAESGETSLEEELNMDLLRQYIAVDFEISQLEDRDALRLYHEKIEQLEQLERELDMISFEAEEVAVRSETDSNLATSASGQQKDSKMDIESNSIISGVSGSLSAKSSIVRRQDNQRQATSNNNSTRVLASGTMMKMASSGKQQQQQQQQQLQHHGGSHKGSDIQQAMRQLDKSQRFTMSKENNLSYATIEEVFNRKIILEKERDKLKKEVEMVIIECDRLQQKYKKRDEILDKLFDGRTGNGLENHLEQQLNWLMEQKHYVDQVFYAWKRAETLTSQTCEQFASALELLKRIPKTQNEDQRQELSKSVCNLLMKSRQDMEQAQRYNPNVDAPFFTEAETERFDKIIETMQSSSISQSDYNQMATVVQFAYKRAVSIRLWLEQILQITIARDSFELAEEYKWIAIQLRKERISLINLKLQDPPYRAMAQSIREQLASQHQRQQQLDHSRQLAITDGLTTTRNKQNEINRDSGIESDGIDIEEDIYRLLEMNKSRLEAAVAASKGAGVLQGVTLDSSGRPVKPPSIPSATSTSGLNSNRQQQLSVAAGGNRTPGSSIKMSSKHDQMMRERIQRRVRGEQPLALSQTGVGMMPMGVPGSDFGHPQGMEDVSNGSRRHGKRDGGTDGGGGRANEQLTTNNSQSSNAGPKQRDGPQSGSSISLTPSKLRIQLDEDSRRSLLSK